MDRREISENNYNKLFDAPLNRAAETDPEFMEILRRFIFADVFSTGVLTDVQRELITVTVLTVNQTLPQLTAHVGAALKVGATPVEIRETVYQCAPFIGFPKTLNAIAAMNGAFTAHGISLPLEDTGTVTDDTRKTDGAAIQYPIYGDEIAVTAQAFPAPFDKAIPDYLTSFGFGDFYTRRGLDTRLRELLILCILTALGTEKQIKAHSLGNMKVGNDITVQSAAVVQALPYVGFPFALNALRIINGGKV